MTYDPPQATRHLLESTHWHFHLGGRTPIRRMVPLRPPASFWNSFFLHQSDGRSNAHPLCTTRVYLLAHFLLQQKLFPTYGNLACFEVRSFPRLIAQISTSSTQWQAKNDYDHTHTYHKKLFHINQNAIMILASFHTYAYIHSI